MTIVPKKILLSAGGTGGHLFPAQALAQEMASRRWKIHLATDHRAEPFVANFPAKEVHIIKSATIGGKNPIALVKTIAALGLGYLSSRRLISKIQPDVVVGFGGYPTVPPLLAAVHKHLPTIIHEQNAVMGRANRFLAGKVRAVATGFQLDDDITDLSASVVLTGNPLRQAVHVAANHTYTKPTVTGPFNLLVFGGSQGAQFFSRVVPQALEMLDPSLACRLRMTMQARPEDAVAVRAILGKLEIDGQVEEFFSDMPQRIANAQLVICRSGASTVSELAMIGRPSILVPYPGALDDDQGKNAAQLEAAGGAVLVRQKELTAKKLANFLRSAMKEPESLALQAENAKKAGVPDAASRLADLVEAHT